MAPSVEISIPTTSISDGPKPYTIYNITLRLPLRSFTVPKRYSDFVAFHQSLTSEVGVAPPASLPQKSWFARTVNNAALTEQRRKGLEAYLQTINASGDARWRTTAAWRTFLNLPTPSSANANANASASATALGLHGALTSPAGGGAPITDPVVWVDCHRNLKTQLHEARLALQRRDQAQTAQQQHESAAAAKRCLIMAGSMITALDRGLKTLAAAAVATTANANDAGKRASRSEHLGEGELRRRRDLLMNARKEKEALEALAHAVIGGGGGSNNSSRSTTTTGAVTEPNGSAAATAQQKHALFAVPSSATTTTTTTTARDPAGAAAAAAAQSSGRGRRVLGGAPVQPETEHTRELDNGGMLELLKERMQEQDRSVEDMTRGVMRLKELGVAINDELELQNAMLGILDEDVTRVGRKLDVAKKRVDKIS